MPIIKMEYYVLPQSELKNIDSLTLFVNSDTGKLYKLIRGITISMELLSRQMQLVSP